MKRPIDAIKIGERHRQDFGDVKGLAASIAKHGLLQPVVITPDELLIDGERRMKACRSLGHYEVEVNVVNPDDLLGAEFDANVQRKDFTRSEAVAIGRLIEEREQPAAQERQREGRLRGRDATRLGAKLAPSPSDADHGGRVREIAAKGVGLSKSSYQRAKEVVQAAEQDPRRYADLQAHMDETGNITGSHRQLRQRQLIGPPPKAVKAADKTRIKVYKDKPTREVIARAMNALEQVGQALERIPDVPPVSAEEHAEWVAIVQRSLKSVRDFQRLLKEGRISDAS